MKESGLRLGNVGNRRTFYDISCKGRAILGADDFERIAYMRRELNKIMGECLLAVAIAQMPKFILNRKFMKNMLVIASEKAQPLHIKYFTRSKVRNPSFPDCSAQLPFSKHTPQFCAIIP